MILSLLFLKFIVLIACCIRIHLEYSGHKYLNVHFDNLIHYTKT